MKAKAARSSSPAMIDGKAMLFTPTASPDTAEEATLRSTGVVQVPPWFVEVVTTNRSLRDPQTLRIATDGRIFSGTDAKQIGLIDDVGLLEDALDVARKMAKAPGAKTVMYKRPYGYRGSIYADTSSATPQAASSNVTKLELPGGPLLPSGFYYLWNP